jgi:hypothetical protein
MRRILTGIAGGFPFEYSDFEQLQNSDIDVIKALLQARGINLDNNVYLNNQYNYDVATDTHTMSEGYAWIDGALAYTPAKQVVGNAVIWVSDQAIGGT